MNEQDYTPEQRKDIEERVAKAQKLLEELNLQPACIMYMHNTGDDVFGIKPRTFLQDTKYIPILSPLQNL